MFIEQAVAACYERTENGVFVYRLSADFPACKGHFEGHPLLPAVCHISFCSDAAGRLLQKPGEIKSVKRAKFISPVEPGMRLAITLTPRSDGSYLAQINEPDKKKKLSQLVLQFKELAS